MASWNEISPDPDIHDLSQIGREARNVEAEEKPADTLHQPASAEEYGFDKLDASDLVDDLTGSFDGEISLPRT